jgi:hypothetical protein
MQRAAAIRFYLLWLQFVNIMSFQDRTFSVSIAVLLHMKILVLGGDFRKGRLELADELQMTNGDGFVEPISPRSIIRIGKVTAEGGISSRLTTMAAGGIVGGIAAGVLAGGLTGPAGAVIGAVAGAALGSGKVIISRVDLADGRYFIASGSPAAWDTLRAMTAQ